jgi:non-homologous end joining protein Ku
MKALWSGILSFGLVNIPVKLYSASRERSLSFRLLDKRETPDVGYFKERELDAAVGLVNSMSQPFNPALFRDTYTEELKKIIADKAHGAKPTKKGRLPTPSPSDMNEIIKLLEKSAGEIATK